MSCLTREGKRLLVRVIGSLGHPPLFFLRLSSNAFSDFGSVGRKKRIGEEVRNKEAQYPSITSEEHGNNETRNGCAYLLMPSTPNYVCHRTARLLTHYDTAVVHY